MMQSEVAALGWIVPQGVFFCLGKRRRFFGRGRFFSCSLAGRRGAEWCRRPERWLLEMTKVIFQYTVWNSEYPIFL